MAILESRQVVVWSVPTFALLLSLVWLGRRRRSRDRDPPTGDPGGLPTDSRQTLVDETPNSGLSSELGSELPEEIHPSESIVDIVSDDTSFEEQQDSGVESLKITLKPEGQVLSDLENLESCAFSTETQDIVSVATEQDSSEDIIQIEEDKAEEIAPDTEIKSAVEESEVETIVKELEVLKVESEEIQISSEVGVKEELLVEATQLEPVIVTEVNIEVESPIHMLEVEPVVSEPVIKVATECCVTAPPEDSTPAVVDLVKEGFEEGESGVAEEKMKEEGSIMEKGVLEKKLASLELDTMKTDESGKSLSERDSANQSPSEVMLASPSISNFSDAHSEVRILFSIHKNKFN